MSRDYQWGDFGMHLAETRIALFDKATGKELDTSVLDDTLAYMLWQAEITLLEVLVANPTLAEYLDLIALLNFHLAKRNMQTAVVGWTG